MRARSPIQIPILKTMMEATLEQFFPERYSDHKSDFLQRGVRGSSQYTGGWNYKVKDSMEFVTQENREGEDDVRTYLFE